MEVTVLILSRETASDGSATARGSAEQFGTEIQWEGWFGFGDSQWSVRIPNGLEQGDLRVVDTDAMVLEIRAQLQSAHRTRNKKTEDLLRATQDGGFHRYVIEDQADG